MFNLAESQGSCHQRAGSVPTLPCRRRSHEGLIHSSVLTAALSYRVWEEHNSLSYAAVVSIINFS